MLLLCIIFLALQLTSLLPLFLCVPFEAVGILIRDLCMQLEPGRAAYG